MVPRVLDLFTSGRLSNFVTSAESVSPPASAAARVVAPALVAGHMSQSKPKKTGAGKKMIATAGASEKEIAITAILKVLQMALRDERDVHWMPQSLAASADTHCDLDADAIGGVLGMSAGIPQPIRPSANLRHSQMLRNCGR